MMAWTLAEWTLRSTLLIVFAGATLWGLRVKDAPLRLTAWTAVLAGVLLMPLFQMAVPAVAIAVPRPWTRSVATKSGRTPSPLPFHLMEPAARESAGKWSLDWPDAAAFVGLTGAVAMMSRLLAGLYFTRRLIRASRKIREGVRESESITVPVTAGLLRPVVLLPHGWREWEPAKLRAVMAHEGAHARGYDPLRRFLASVYRASCWYNPLAWWLSAHLAALAEAKSDDAALAEVRDEALYAEILVSFWERAPRRVIWEGVGMSRSGKLTRRMERILDSERRLSASVARSAGLAVVATAAFLIYVSASVRPMWAEPPQLPATLAAPVAPLTLALEPQRVSEQVQVRPRAVDSSDAYKKWLNEDVSYLISTAERVAFENLKSDPERGHFVAQFWEVHGGEKRKEEHYRRILYANDHFGTSVPGWKTDRGRIYIRFGPPDEIESHPTAANGEPPHEDWMYHHLDGVGDNIIWKFVDVTLTGDYPLALWDQAVRPREGGLNVQLAPSTAFPSPLGSAGSSDGPVLFRKFTVPRSFVVSVPLGDAREPVHVFGRVTDAGRRLVETFEATLNGPLYERNLSLEPGSYVLNLVVKPAGGGNASRQELGFEVK